MGVQLDRSRFTAEELEWLDMIELMGPADRAAIFQLIRSVVDHSLPPRVH